MPISAYTPGMYATVRLTLADKKDALAVPIPIQTVSAGDKSHRPCLQSRTTRLRNDAVTVGLETSS